ncbi:hypothetical protein GCM10010441_47070 [Kitasatospora paracochleata]
MGGEVEEGDRPFVAIAGDGSRGQVVVDRVVVADVAAHDRLGEQQCGEGLGGRAELEAGVGSDGAEAVPVGVAAAGDDAFPAGDHGEGEARGGCGAGEDRAQAASQFGTGSQVPHVRSTGRVHTDGSPFRSGRACSRMFKHVRVRSDRDDWSGMAEQA